MRIDMVMHNKNVCVGWFAEGWEIVLFTSLEVIRGVDIELYTTWGGESWPVMPNRDKVWPFTVTRGVMDIA